MKCQSRQQEQSKQKMLALCAGSWRNVAPVSTILSMASGCKRLAMNARAEERRQTISSDDKCEGEELGTVHELVTFTACVWVL